MKSHCVKEKKQTECVDPSGYNPKLQKKVIDYGLQKLNPLLHNIGSQPLTQLSTKVRPNQKYKTDGKEPDNGSLDIHKAIGKLPKPQLDFTFSGHKFTGPYNPLDEQLLRDENNGEILEIYDMLSG